ncbi:MAG: Slp family lipoprotein [Gammaproteobacteria bacterium]|nr:Slp family lipoprotein [Gammaproteobacteria bacterium]
MNKLGIILLGALLVQACASQIPHQIQNAPADSPSVSAARVDVKGLVGTRVRWGGTIASVENGASQTLIEVVARSLSESARPSESDVSQGRFLARFQGFLDPAIYTNGRQLTVVGALKGEETRTIDQFDYSYPVVAVESHHLWDPLPEYQYARDPYLHSPYYYDPFFYDPFLYSPYYWRRPYYY